MDGTSSVNRPVGLTEDLFLPAHDGTLLILRKFPGGKQGVLIIPGLGERVDDAFYDDLARSLADKTRTAFLLELRGHGLSEGHWTPQDNERDLIHVVQLVHRSYPSLYLVASGISADLLLQQEQQLHLNGMVLLQPHLSHNINYRVHGKRHTHSYTMPPVRVQTPTILLVKDSSQELLRRIFGHVHIFAGWRPPSTRAEHTVQVMRVQQALADLAQHERPIFFTTAR